MSVLVKKNLVPSSKYNIKCPFSMSPQYITVHNTANDASAANEIAYMLRNNLEISYHFAVDDKEVIQGVPTDRNAWHCGDGRNGNGNRKSIGVEICYSKSGGERYKKAEALAIKFIAQLLKERGWGIDRVKKHRDWSGKYCPHRILSEGRWDSFLKAVDKELRSSNNSVAPAEPSQPSKTAAGSFRIKVKAAELWYYNKPGWNAKKATVKRGEVFTVVETLTVNGSKMYKLKSGTYITANPQYVEVL